MTKERVCKVTAKSAGEPGIDDPGPAASGARKVTCAGQWGDAMDCDPTSSGAWWSADRECWVDPGGPATARHATPVEGATPTGRSTAAGRLRHRRSAAAQRALLLLGRPAPAQVNPARLAREAVDSMNLVAPTVGAHPAARSAEAVSLIGLPTWLWIDSADEHSWGPITRTATAGGVTVTATAKVTKVVWDMGDGNTVSCTNKGTEWTAAKGTGDSPTCGYRYTPPRGAHDHRDHVLGGGLVRCRAVGHDHLRPVRLPRRDVVELRAVISRMTPRWRTRRGR